MQHPELFLVFMLFLFLAFIYSTYQVFKHL